MKNLSIILGTIFSLCFMIITSCSSSTDPATPNIIWNLQTGNNWTFTDQFMYPDSVFVDTVFVEISKHHSFNYQNSELIAACLRESSYSMQQTPEQITYQLFNNNDDGLYSYGNLIEQADSTILEISINLLFKFPVEIGDIWQFNSNNIECTSHDEPFNTPYGDFSCYVYKLTKTTEITYFYCVPYIGIVGIITEDTSGNTIYMRILLDYNIG